MTHDDLGDQVTCGHCGRSWSDKATPTPSARCPFEYEHVYDEELERCERCGAPLADSAGEGYDGHCGDCADVLESKRHWG